MNCSMTNKASFAFRRLKPWWTLCPRFRKICWKFLPNLSFRNINNQENWIPKCNAALQDALVFSFLKSVSFFAAFRRFSFQLSKSFKTENELNPFLSCFRFLVSRKDPEIRLRCAKQFPALLHVAGGRKYSVFFHDTFQNLSTDLNEDVRITIASQFHDVTFLL